MRAGTLAFALVLTSAAQLGCEAEPSRRFAVTVQDTIETKCVGVSNDLGLSQDNLDDLADQIRRAWKANAEANPPTAEGRLLRVNELDTRMSAWFDPYVTVDDLTAPRRYADPHTVYQGETLDDQIEGVFEVRFNTDDDDQQSQRTLCGNRLRYAGLLSLTDVGGVQGRIEWAEYTWIESPVSACAGFVVCSRYIGLEGLEE
jgi:hypothetical protein